MERALVYWGRLEHHQISFKVLGCNRTSADMISVSDWVNKHSLVDLPLGGARLAWSNHQPPSSLSLLDKFLLSSDWLDLFPEVCQMALPKPTSDHCLILLDTKC
eukprot:TRINITY_DN14308_c0_g1_i1.p2 TRINITY_DN14308_c0_g1~~TRINITY_DN14308_c0_g1_i1.p2  ORF type:complete len:104 (+),score=7.86 TRINITY_DN14308_c0_g1_i1:19-330(+)